MLNKMSQQHYYDFPVSYLSLAGLCSSGDDHYFTPTPPGLRQNAAAFLKKASIRVAR
jgi:hypothetical protein